MCVLGYRYDGAKRTTFGSSFWNNEEQARNSLSRRDVGSTRQKSTMSPRRDVTTSRRHHVATSPRRDVTTSRRHHVATSPRRDVTTSRRHHVATSPRRDVTTSRRHHVATSPRRDVTTSQRHHVATSARKSASHHLMPDGSEIRASGGVQPEARISRDRGSRLREIARDSYRFHFVRYY